jgi:Novel STAND NTPase 1
MEPSRQVAGGVPLDLDNPWPGLESYDESAHDYFSGRTAEADELLRRIVDEPITVLFGKSGLGKTSLLKAGVFPRLRQKDLLPVFIRLQIRPDTEPLIEQVQLALLDELRNEGIEHLALAAGETLWEYLHRTGQEFWTRRNRLVRPVFVFDQFEELFTLGRAVPGEIATFRSDLADLVENRIPAALAQRLENRSVSELGLDTQAMPYKVVFSLCEDFLADLEGWRLTMPSLRRNRMRLLPLGTAQAFEAVYNEYTKHLVPEPLARTIVAFLSSRGTTVADDADAIVEPALLSLFCRGVNDHRKREGKVLFDEALLAGGKDTIVTDFYRTSLVDQLERVHRFIGDELITEHGFCNSYSVDDALARGCVTADELQTLINRHLLRKEHHLGTDRVELTHDLLTKAVLEEREERRHAERIDRERRERRKLWTIACISGFLVIVFFGLAVYAWIAGTRANEARDRSRSKELGALAAGTMSADPALAVAFALEGLGRADTVEARSALLDAAQYAWPAAVLAKDALGGAPVWIALSQDGRRLVVAVEGQVTLWDVTARTPSRMWAKVLEASTSLAFSPDHKVLAVGRQTSIDLVDADTGDVHRPIPLPSKRDRRVAFSPDGHWLAWSQNDDRVWLLDYRDEEAKPAEVAAEGVIAFAVIGDGRRIVIATDAPLSAYAREQQPDGSWSHVELSLGECGGLESVSPGAQFSSVSWKARTCTVGNAGLEFSERDTGDTRRHTFDIVWSAAGGASTEVLVQQNADTQDVIVARVDPTGARMESWIKGADSVEDKADKSGVISMDELGTRMALTGRDPVTKRERVTVYSVADHKPFLSRLRNGSFAAAPDGTWMALVRPAASGSSAAAIDVISFTEDFTRGGRIRLGRAIDVPLLPAQIHASPSSLVAVLPTKPLTVVVLDLGTGKPRFELRADGVQPLGATRELLLVEASGAPARIVKTGDGSTVAPWGPPAPQTGVPEFKISPNKEVLAVLRPQAGNTALASAAVYSVRGDSLVLSGHVVDMPADVLWEYAELRPTDDARSIVEVRRASRDRRRFAKTVWPVTSEDNAAGVRPAPPVEGRDDVVSHPDRSPLGGFEIRDEERSDAGEPTVQLLVRRTDHFIVKRFEARTHHAFSSDDRWLVSWKSPGIQVLDLTRGEVAFALSLDEVVQAVRFDARNTILDIQFAEESVLVPLDRALMERFAGWLTTRKPTKRERCMYGLATEAQCRDEVVAQRTPRPAPHDKSPNPAQ